MHIFSNFGRMYHNNSQFIVHAFAPSRVLLNLFLFKLLSVFQKFVNLPHLSTYLSSIYHLYMINLSYIYHLSIINLSFIFHKSIIYQSSFYHLSIYHLSIINLSAIYHLPIIYLSLIYHLFIIYLSFIYINLSSIYLSLI